MHVDILRPAPSHTRARYPRIENVRIKSGDRSGTFTVWADPPEAGPHTFAGRQHIRVATRLAGPMMAHEIDSSYPGPHDLRNVPDSTD